ncbi:MAG: SPASM domain-containing protein, partial [Deltaproteobacteria bacterium]|nr:SPASM domain-containing protein [Deltaproteobacteria bacterium]
DLVEWMIKTLQVDHIDECRGCSWRYICGGGCPVTRLTVLSNPDVTPEIAEYCSKINCNYNKKILELLFWELAEEASMCRPSASARDPSVALDPHQTVHC